MAQMAAKIYDPLVSYDNSNTIQTFVLIAQLS